MHSAEAQFIEVAKRYAVVGMQVTQAFEAETAALRVDLILTQERLSTSAGTKASLAALEALAELTARHKTAFMQVVVASAAALRDVLSELPEQKQVEHGAGIVASVNWQLAAQGEFYDNRGRWIDAAKALCNLVEDRRPTARFLPEGVVFADEADYETFQSLLAVVDEVHHREVQLMTERVERIATSASILGLRVAP